MDANALPAGIVPAKWLMPDGSIQSHDGEVIQPVSPERARLYAAMSAQAAKVMLADGTIVTTLPWSGAKDAVAKAEATTDELAAKVGAVINIATSSGQHAEEAAVTAQAVGEQLLADKEAGLFKGDKGEKGDPGEIALTGDDADKVIAALGNLDAGYFTDTEPTTVAIHNSTPTAHGSMNVDGSEIGLSADGLSLEEHMSDANAHQNIILDGNYA